MKPQNVYVIHGTTYPKSVQQVAPPIYTMVSPPASADTAASGSEDVKSKSASDCEGPVRHSDTPMCVARKALAQALQAEADVATVDSAAADGRRRAGKLQRWERAQHQALSDDMDKAFDKIGTALDEERRRISNEERQTDGGDREVKLKTDLARRREGTDFAEIRRRINEIALEAPLVSKMTGPPGAAGPRVAFPHPHPRTCHAALIVRPLSLTSRLPCLRLIFEVGAPEAGASGPLRPPSARQ